MSIKTEQLKDIATWMVVEQPTKLPEVLQGIFFMDGNVMPDSCLTMNGAEWRSDSLTLILPVFAPLKWAFNSSTAGHLLLYFVKFARLTYAIRFEDDTLQRAHIAPILFGWQIPQWLIDFLMYRDHNDLEGAVWHRQNILLQRPPKGEYTLRRIVDKNGKHTSVFEEMLSKVDNNCLVIAKENASFIDRVLNNLQIWALQHPDQQISKLILPLVSLIEGLLANNPIYLNSKRLAFGPNFCCAGQVVMGEFKTLETALTSPQSRTWRLGTTVLDANHAPNQDVGGRNVFLLSLSDKAAGGSSDHENFRKCMQDYLLNDVAAERQRDATAKQLLDKLAVDYAEMPHGQGGAFFTNNKRGLMGFMVRYLHYVLFGLDPNNEESINLLTDLHYTRMGTVHYFAGIGSLLQRLNLKGHGDLPNLIEQVATLYEHSPALADFEDSSENSAMTRRELAKLMTSIMSIAALQGPLHLAYTAMGYRPLPAYPKRQTAIIDPTHYWDQLDFDDSNSVRLYLLECARLWAPVSATHRVAPEPFTATISGKEQMFPGGTKVLIPLSLGLLDESFWGPTTYEFNTSREHLCPFHMGFHSVGDQSAGRICPGKDIALNMLVDVVSRAGRVRRASELSLL